VKPPGRRLSAEETALWARVAATIAPLHPSRPQPKDSSDPAAAIPPPPPAPLRLKGRVPPAPPPAPQPPSAPRALDRHGLDAGWERRLARGLITPDVTLDLHGAGLDAAHARLDHGLTLAAVQGARVMLLITGRARPRAAADRSEARGAIRAKFLDWLVAGPHASRIAAVRPAHIRHGGPGAVYIILRRPR
jgi:DNA-nicking Smr family endonuclease